MHLFDVMLHALQVNAAVIKDDSNGKDSNGNSIAGMNGTIHHTQNHTHSACVQFTQALSSQRPILAACRTACIGLSVADASSTASDSCVYDRQRILNVVQSYRTHLLRVHGAIVL
jgi:hypothetical protein